MKERQFYDENEQKRVNKLVDDMTLFDDDLMSHVFDKNIEATELILRIILGEDIKVISVEGQDELKNPLVDGRNITLDVFHQKESEDMHYKALADGVKHFKETEEGRETMCESVKEYAKEYADERDVIKVRKLMENLQLTLEQALNALDIHETSRTYIEKRLQK